MGGEKKFKLWFFGCLLTLFAFESSLWASRPNLERSLEDCRSAISSFSGQYHNAFSSSLLMPVGRLLAMRKLEYIAKMHVLGDTKAKEHPTPGLAQMFLTASSAADALIVHLEERAVRPQYVPGDIMQGAIETLALMLERQPRYIRDAVLIRDGVMMVVPLLERVVKGKFPEEKPIYRPVIVKGHQELEDSDILSAAFASWALAGPSNLGRLHDEALIFLKPMAAKRDLKRDERTDHYESFQIHVRDHLPEVERLHQRYVQLISNPDELHQLPLRRNSAALNSSWFPYLRDLMRQEGNLTMMPFPPSETELMAFAQSGITKISELAQISLHSEAFWRLSMKTGIDPEKLRYFVAHALAIHEQKVIRTRTYENPFLGAQWLVHVDFEDFMERDVRSGVYMFGIALEKTGSRKNLRIEKKQFVLAPMAKDPERVITQREVDFAWANFIKFFQDQFGQNLAEASFLITVYSHHERTKFNQQFDIVEAELTKFSPQQQASRYFQSFVDENGKPMGRLIRNRSFFKKYSTISPSDVFVLIDKMVDLLPYVRWNFSFPTHTNGLKYILDYIMPPRGAQLRYPDGWNGLESIEWAKKAYQSGEEALFERIRIYNEFDIDSNYYIADFIRREARRPTDPRMKWNDEDEARLEAVAEISEATRRTQDISLKSEILEKILRKPVSHLTLQERDELEAILDRAPYMSIRKQIMADESYSKMERDQILQRAKYEFLNSQKHSLIEFFEKVGGYDRLSADDETLDWIADLFLNHRVHEINPKTIQRIIVYENMMMAAKKLKWRKIHSVFGKLEIPASWQASVNAMKSKKEMADLGLSASDWQTLMMGIYFKRVLQ
ncbi:MAG: hypothetical protein ACO3LE_01295 [Bdellovibrionota bacterium]